MKGWLVFWVFFFLVGTLVVCRRMLAGGCLVFVGLRLFDLFSLLVVDGGFVYSKHRW